MPEIDRPTPPEKLYQQAYVDLPQDPTPEDISKAFDDNERSFVAWASKPIMDRDQEVIEAGAWELANFDLNPVILWSHDYGFPAVGQALWTTKQRTGLKFKPSFADTDFGIELYRLYRQRVLRAFSVGFKPLEWHFGDKPEEPSLTYTEVELLEISCVNVPAMPTALVALMYEGKIHTKRLQEAIKWSMDQAGIYKSTKTFMEVNTDMADNNLIDALLKRIEALEKTTPLEPLVIKEMLPDLATLSELPKEQMDALIAGLQAMRENLYPNSEPPDVDIVSEGADDEPVDVPAEMSDEDLDALADRLAQETDDTNEEVKPINDEDLDALLDSLSVEPDEDEEDAKGMTLEIFNRLKAGEVI